MSQRIARNKRWLEQLKQLDETLGEVYYYLDGMGFLPDFLVLDGNLFAGP